MMQTKQEREALNLRWESLPQVRAFREASKDFATTNELEFNAAGVTAMLQFAIRWQKINGFLPPSGIQTGWK